MKGALVAICISFSVIASSLSLVSVAYQLGIYQAAELPETREHWQQVLVSRFERIGFSRFEQYRLYDDKFKTQASAFNLVTLLLALPVFLLAPVVILRRRTPLNAYWAMLSLLLAVFAVWVPVAWAYCVTGLVVAWSLVNVYLRPQPPVHKAKPAVA